jgi:hypothetical protein
MEMEMVMEMIMEMVSRLLLLPTGASHNGHATRKESSVRKIVNTLKVK